MKILLVARSEILPLMVTNILNPQNDYCAFVVDEVNPAKEFAKKVGLSEDLIYPLYELKNVINEIYFDVLICVSDNITGIPNLFHYMFQCGCPKNKLVHYLHLANGTVNFVVERALRYYQEHSEEIEIFATGNSHTGKSLDANQFKYKLLNFGRVGQDLYYGYQIAKRVLTPKTRGGDEYPLCFNGCRSVFFACRQL